MKKRAISVVIMICWGFLFSPVLLVGTTPPRQITYGDIAILLVIPAGTFVAALPSVPLAWFGCYAIILGGLTVMTMCAHIMGTVRVWGWAEDFRAYLLPVAIFVSVVCASVLAAWLRQLLHEGIAHWRGHAINSVQRTSHPR